jgi:hypothetical protein
LIRKWRTCAQKTGERVFCLVRDRIDRQGGFKEWMRGQRGWNDSRSQDENGESQERSQEEDGEDLEDIPDEFTMESMLKMAGIEEKLIGWDRELNNFVKT